MQAATAASATATTHNVLFFNQNLLRLAARRQHRRRSLVHPAPIIHDEFLLI